jgi:hypothetical protein
MTLRRALNTVIAHEAASHVCIISAPHRIASTTDNPWSVNIYFQRNPAVEPEIGCANPEAHALVVCGLYNHAVNPSEALNHGQARGPVDDNGEAFQVVIRGSNSK